MLFFGNEKLQTTGFRVSVQQTRNAQEAHCRSDLRIERKKQKKKKTQTLQRYETPAPDRTEVNRMYAYSDGHEVRRENQVITVQVPPSDHRRGQHAGHRFSPQENHQVSAGTNVGARYQTSPTVLAATEDYDATAIVTQPGSTVHLGSPAPPYSPPIDGIRAGQQLVTSYADASAGVVKYDAEAAAAAENIKPPSTYINLETVAIPSTQTVQYTQYLAGNETYQQPPTYSYAKPGEPVILAYPPATHLGSRATEVRNCDCC